MSTRPQGKQGSRTEADDLLSGPKGATPMPAGTDEPMLAQGRQRTPGGGYQRQSMMETIIKAFIRSIASSIGRTIVRTITRRMR